MLMEFLNSPSMLAIFPIQDWLSIDGRLRNADYMEERINQPADPHHHWRYRLHLNLEELRDAPEFCSSVSTLIKDSGRG